MAPETEGMAQFMQRRGLQGLQALIGAEQHLHTGLRAPDPLALHLQQLQQGAAMAGPSAALGIQERRPAPLDQDLGPGGIVHHHQAEF